MPDQPDDFGAMIDKFESQFGVNFTPKQEKAIQNAPNPQQVASGIAKKAHHTDYMSRAGGKFSSGKAGAAYYKQKGDK